MYKACLVSLVSLLFAACKESQKNKVDNDKNDSVPTVSSPSTKDALQGFDSARYQRLLQHVANGDTTGLWPVKEPQPRANALFPYHRIVAYYGNLYSTRMGALGEWPKDSMLRRLMGEVDRWKAADSLLPVVPALHYIAVTAQSAPTGGNYRLRMPHHQIDTVLNWAKEINALVFIDIQVGLSSVQSEVPEFEKYLSMPNVHFGIDPEFSMKSGAKPGSEIGSFDAADINWVTHYLDSLVTLHKLPPKILVVHRFTGPMVTNAPKIVLRPGVQIVMDMDGWGGPAKKINTYQRFIQAQPVQYTGFKVFYNNDTKEVGEKVWMSPADMMKLTPRPVYIQYQ